MTAFIDAEFTVPASATISVTTNGGGPTTVTITAGSYFARSFPGTLSGILTSQRPVSGGSWSVTLDETTAKYTIAVTAGTFSITWTASAVRTLLGFASNISGQTSVTATSAARGVWHPNCPIALDSDLQYPDVMTDHRQTQSPTGFVLGLVGNSHYRFRGLRYTHVEHARVFGASGDSGVATSGGTWQQFLYDAQLGLGHSYFTPSARVRVNHNGDVDQGYLGYNFFNSATVGWRMKGVNAFSPRKVHDQWTGLWSIEIPELVGDGT